MLGLILPVNHPFGSKFSDANPYLSPCATSCLFTLSLLATVETNPTLSVMFDKYCMFRGRNMVKCVMCNPKYIPTAIYRYLIQGN